MGSLTNKFRPYQQQANPCTRTHQIGALALVAISFFLTRLFDQTFSPCSRTAFQYSSNVQLPISQDVLNFNPDRSVSWPVRGFGSELNLKIYVYDENEIDGLKALMYGRDGKISPDSCIRGQWGTQVKIHRMFLQSRFRTENKEVADLFFVPAYVKCVRMMGGLNDKEINQTYVKVLSQMPYFRLSGGRNHIFVFPSGAGAHLFKSWATYLNHSIFLTPEMSEDGPEVISASYADVIFKYGNCYLVTISSKSAKLPLENAIIKEKDGDRTDKRDTSAFNTWKDIIIPGNIDDGMTKGIPFVEPLPLSRRKYLANFLGRAQKKVGRLKLIELSKQYPDKLESPELKFSGPDKLGRKEYFEHLRNAKFCLAPRGESSWTLRFYESYFVECVPVLLSDQVELPFQNVIDYTQISIKWPSTRIGPQLLEYLESIPDEVLEKMIARGRQVRCLFAYAPESQPCSAINGIFWELQRKIRHFHGSTETFWLHNRSIVNRDLVSFSDWKPPMPLP